MSGGPPHGRDDPALRGDDDAVWEDLVARIGPLRPPGDAEDGPPPARRATDGHDEPGPPHPAPPARGPGPRDDLPAEPGGPDEPDGPHERSPTGGTGPRDSPSPDGDDLAADRYVPDEAPPLASAGARWWAPWLALVGAPLVLAVAALTRSSVPGWLVMVCVAVFAGGAVAAVLRLPSAPAQDPGDDGARL